MSNASCTTLWVGLRTPQPPDLRQESRPGTMSAAEVRARVEAAMPAGASAAARERVMAASLLYHDHHNAAHDLVQDMTDPDGSLVHALVHRREPDYWNANYWYRQAGDHELYRLLAARLATMRPEGSAASVANRLVLSGTLDPMALVAACEGAGKMPATDPVPAFLRRLQESEFELLIGLLAARR